MQTTLCRHTGGCSLVAAARTARARARARARASLGKRLGEAARGAAGGLLL